MLELAINLEADSAEKGAPTLSHFYAVAMNATQNATSAISAGKK